MNTLAPTAAWSDKRYLWLLSPAIPLISVLGLVGYQQTHQTWLLWLFPFVVHVLIPVLDWLFGEDFSNPPESVVAELDRDFFYRALLWLFIPFQMAGTVLGAWLVAGMVLMPVVGMFMSAAQPPGLVEPPPLTLDRLVPLVVRTLALASCVSALSLSLGTWLAWVAVKSSYRFSGVLAQLGILPLVIPSYLIAAILREELAPQSPLGSLLGVEDAFMGFGAAVLVLTL